MERMKKFAAESWQVDVEVFSQHRRIGEALLFPGFADYPHKR